MKLSKTIIGAVCIVAAIGVGAVQWYMVKTASPAQTPAASINQSSGNSANPYDTLKDGEMLYSIPVKNLADSLSGNLRIGDIVRVAVPAQNTGNNAVPGGNSDELKALQYVRVESVTTSNGQNVGNGSQTASSSTTTNSNQPATVTLAVNEQQLNALTALGANEISFALVSRGDESQAKTLLAKQSAILEGLQ